MKTPWLVAASARFRSASRSSKRRNRDAASATINPIAIVVPPAVIAIDDARAAERLVRLHREDRRSAAAPI